MALTATTSHGRLSMAPDGGFAYLPDAGFVGTDTFSIAMARGPQVSASVAVLIRVVATASSAPPSSIVLTSPGPDTFAIGTAEQGAASGPGVAFGTLGPLDFAFEWLIPGFAVSLPGLLVVLAVLAQVVVGAGWLPLVRRELGDPGARRRRRPAHPTG